MEIVSGMIKKVLTETQYELYKKEEIDLKEVTLFDTLRVSETKSGEPLEYLPFRVSYKETDIKGREKYIYDDQKKEYIILYSKSPVIYAYGKEMRILLDMGENAPVKITYEEKRSKDGFYFRVCCIQDQKAGKIC